MKYPWIAEAIIEWKKGSCRYEDEEVFCSECKLNCKICDELSELATTIANKIKEEDN